MNVFRLALLLSIGLNVFFVGWWVGDAMHIPGGSGRPPSFRERLEGRLSPEGMRAISDVLNRVDGIMQSGMDDRDGQMARIRELLIKQPFDRAAVGRLLDELPEDRRQARGQMSELLSSALERLSLEDRAAFARAVFMRPPRP
jgi:uncharacterized membrane protein